MSAALHHLRLSAWTIPSWPRRVLGVLLTAFLLPCVGVMVFHFLGTESALRGIGVSAGILVMGPVLGSIALPGDKGTGTLPALPLAPRVRALVEALGTLLLPLLPAALIPLLGFLAFEPILEPTFGKMDSPMAVLLWGWAFKGDGVALYALLGFVALAPVVLGGAFDRTQGSPLGWAGGAAALLTALAGYALHPLGQLASVAGMLLVFGLVLAVGQALAERLRGVSWRPRSVGPLRRAPFSSLGSELLRGWAEALGRAGLLVAVNAVLWFGLGVGEELVLRELWLMIVLVVAIMGSIPPKLFYATHGGAQFDLGGALSWLPRSRRWHVSQAMAQGALTLTLVAALLGALVATEQVREVTALSMLGIPLLVCAPISARVGGGRGPLLGLVGAVAFFGAVMAEMIASVPLYPEMPLWLALIPWSVVGLFSLPTLALAWVDSAGG